MRRDNCAISRFGVLGVLAFFAVTISAGVLAAQVSQRGVSGLTEKRSCYITASEYVVATSSDGLTKKTDTASEPDNPNKQEAPQDAQAPTNDAPGTKTAARRPDGMSVVTTGVGVDAQSALDNALVNAVQQAVGVLVDAEVIVENDELVSERIITASSAFVDAYETVKDWRQRGLCHVRIVAHVRSRKLEAAIEAAGITTLRISGRNLSANLKTRARADEMTAALLRNRIMRIPEIVLTIAQDGPVAPVIDVAQDSTDARLRAPIAIGVDMKKYRTAVNEMCKDFSRLALAELRATLELDPQAPIEYGWRDGAGHSLRRSRQTGYMRTHLYAPKQRGLDGSAPFPPPEYFLPTKWYSYEAVAPADSAHRIDVRRRSREFFRELRKSLRSRTRKLNEPVGWVVVITNISSSGRVSYRLFAFPARCFTGFSDCQSAKIDATIRALALGDREVASKTVSIAIEFDDPWNVRPPLLVGVSGPERREFTEDPQYIIAVVPGCGGGIGHRANVGQDAHMDRDAQITCEWRGRLYLDIEEGGVGDIERLELGVNWLLPGMPE